jgi:predicted transcriptional regulator
MLRRLVDKDGPCSSAQLARETGLPAPSITYHLRVLQQCKATRPIKEQADLDPAVLTHESAISENRWVRRKLDATKARDEAERRESARRP